MDPFYTGIGLFYLNLLILGVNEHRHGQSWNRFVWYKRFHLPSWCVWFVQIDFLKGAVVAIVFWQDPVWALALLWFATAIGVVHLVNVFIFAPRRALARTEPDCLPSL